MSNYSEGNSFEEILERCLAKVPEGIDKRQGSIIYDTLAPFSAELANNYITLDVYSNQTSIDTATGQNLDNIAIQYGVLRRQATNAIIELIVYDSSEELMTIDIGTKFSTPNENGGLNYEVTELISTGYYKAVCETAGEVGNAYIGEVLPLQYVNNLGNAILNDVLVPGEDIETDDELRQRILDKISQESFAGNKAAYKKMLENIDGVESCKIYPVWAGGGTIKIAVIASNYEIPNPGFINEIQEMIDPTVNQGKGIGLAPIGHTVTIVAPTEQTISIAATLTLESGSAISKVQEPIEKAIGDYFKEVQNKWGYNDTLIVYMAKVIAAILEVSQVINVSDLTINGNESDFTIDNSSPSSIKFPKLGTITLTADS